MVFGTRPVAASGYTNPNNDYEGPITHTDGITSISFSPVSNIMASSSWDNSVQCYEVQQQNNTFNVIQKASIKHDGPVLCTVFSSDGSTIFSGSCDNTAKMWQLNGPAQGQQIASHDSAIRNIGFIQELNLVVTSSWDKTIKYWDTRTSTPQMVVQLEDKIIAMDASKPYVIAGTANRNFYVYDLAKPNTPFNKIVSHLKYQTRSLAIAPDHSAFLASSIAGRAAIQYIQPTMQSKSFGFKCHRVGNDCYPVNAVDYHPDNKIVTTGGEGSYIFWDPVNKMKLKSFEKTNQSISACKFNKRGDIFAYALSYDWQKGMEGYKHDSKNVIRLHQIQTSELQKQK